MQKNCLYVDPANPRGLKGHPEILPYFTKLLAANPTWEWKMDKLFPILNGFILKWNARIPVGSKIISISGMDIVKIEGKKIIRNEVYFDRTSWLRAIRDQ